MSWRYTELLFDSVPILCYVKIAWPKVVRFSLFFIFSFFLNVFFVFAATNCMDLRKNFTLKVGLLYLNNRAKSMDFSLVTNHSSFFSTRDISMRNIST